VALSQSSFESQSSVINISDIVSLVLFLKKVALRYRIYTDTGGRGT